MILTDNWKHM